MMSKTKNAIFIAPSIIPAVANDFPLNSSGVALIFESADMPSTTATIPGIGPRHPPATTPTMPVIIDPSANPWLGCFGGRYGGGGGCHAPGAIGGRSSGAIQPPGAG